MSRRLAAGFSLIEVTIAVALGLFLLASFLAALAQCRAQFAVQESVAQLQDSARQALAIVVPEIEHAGFYGFTHLPAASVERGGAVLAQGEELRQPDASAAITPARGLPAGAHDCGVNFAVDLALAVQASNNSFALGAAAADCAPTGSAGGAHVGSDTLTVRHASGDIVTARAGRIQVYSRRFGVAAGITLFGDGHAPGVIDVDHELRDLEVRTFYVANSSVDRPGWPALRVKSLTEASGRAQFRDEELLAGVEDLQVELGIARRDGAVARVRYVAPDAPEARVRSIVAVRFWIRLRAETTEAGFFDARTLRYADITFTPTADEARQRRIVVQRTVALRNAEPP